MAINRAANQTTGIEELPLYFNNGDLSTLREAVNRLGFKDEESMLRYMLAILSRSATRSITVIDQTGNKTELSPSDALLRQKPPQV